MKTKLQTKFDKIFKTHNTKQKLLDKEYEKSLVAFIRKEIIGKNSFEQHLDKECQYAYDVICDNHAGELIEMFVKPSDVLEGVIISQIGTLENYEDFLDGEDVLYETALSREGIRL